MSKQTGERPVGQGPDELEELELRQRMQRIGRKILVMSGKGGVGKSTVAANLAVALAGQGKKVGLLDVDLHGPSIPTRLGLSSQKLGQNREGRLEPLEADGVKVISIGMLLKTAADPVVWRGPLKYNVIRQFLKDVSWGDLDFLIIDSPPGTGDEPLSIAQMLGAGTETILVTTPQVLAVADVRRSISFCRMMDLQLDGLIENMSGLACPHCGETINLFKSGGGEALAHEMDVPFLGAIPLDPGVVEICDQGEPFIRSHPESPAGKAMAAIIELILKTPGEKKGSSPVPNHPEVTTMKIALPTLDKKLCLHFGHCQEFTLVEVDPEKKTILETQYLTPPPHEPGVLPNWLKEQGANVIIAGGMGQRAQGLLNSHGIEVVVGAPMETPEKVVEAFLAGTLEAADNVCDH